MNCYLCSGRSLTVLRTKLRHGITRNVLECRDCGLVYLQPGKEDLRRFYSEDYRDKHSPVLGKRLTCREIFEAHLPFQEVRVKRLEPVLKPSFRVMDIGCSTGQFLYAIKDHVREAVGLEINREEARFAHEELGFRIYTEPLADADIPAEHFDLVTLFHVLEHIDDPIALLKTALRYLKPDGYLCLEVPNLEDALLSLHQVREYENFWYREPHIFYFSTETLSSVLRRSGYHGEIRSVQRYSLLNHLNWRSTGAPQKSMDDGMSSPTLLPAISEKAEGREEINEWFRGVDQQYKTLLEKHGIGDSLFFLGEPRKPRDLAPGTGLRRADENRLLC